MRIGIDARILAHPKCGISTYVDRLITNFLVLGPAIEIVLFSDSDFHPCHAPVAGLPRVKKVIFSSGKKEKKRWLKALPQKLKEYGVDLYHATWNDSVPYPKPCPCLLTIHDLAPWVLGKHFTNKRKELRYKLRTFFSAHQADLILTDSLSSKNDIVKLCRIKEEKIKVILLGVDPEFVVPAGKEDIDRALVKYGLAGKRYIIHSLGIDHPRRNALFVLEAFSRVAQKEPELSLVYTGNYYKDGAIYKKMVNRIAELGLEKRVTITGWIDLPDLKALLCGSTIAVLPSLYEGFGLPILESFACGVAVITSDRSSIPEVAADAAILIDPFDVENLSAKILDVLTDNALRSELVRKGLERVKLFSWRNTAKDTLAAYAAVGKK